MMAGKDDVNSCKQSAGYIYRHLYCLDKLVPGIVNGPEEFEDCIDEIYNNIS